MTALERIKEARVAWILESRAIWIAAVRKHAVDHYNQNGWDYVVEAWDDEDIARAIGNATTLKGAIWNVGRAIKPLADYRADIKASAF